YRAAAPRPGSGVKARGLLSSGDRQRARTARLARPAAFHRRQISGRADRFASGRRRRGALSLALRAAVLGLSPASTRATGEAARRSPWPDQGPDPDRAGLAR